MVKLRRVSKKPSVKRRASTKRPKRPASKLARKQARKPARTTKVASNPRARKAPAAAVTVEQEALRAKFELGPPSEWKLLDAREKAVTIPWSYGRDRVAAMAVDPERLFVYWEVTDEAIARARAGLGRAGDDARLDLRIHDVTSILYDGTNAHHSFDVLVGRGDRQWFVRVGRPTSTVVVELGLLSKSGAFTKIARSHRVDFPAREAAPPDSPDAVEWLTVRLVAGQARPAKARASAGRGAARSILEIRRSGPRGDGRLLASWELRRDGPAAAAEPAAHGGRPLAARARHRLGGASEQRRAGRGGGSERRLARPSPRKGGSIT